MTDRVFADPEIVAEGLCGRAVHDIEQACLRGVADGRMEEAGADIAIRFEDGGHPRGVAARRDVRLESGVRAEMRNDATQFLG